MTCVETAFKLMTEGKDVLDSLIAGVNIVELDPEDTSVGYGGLPNADGVVQLDASVMHGPLKRGGAVACLEGVRTPSRVARKVMESRTSASANTRVSRCGRTRPEVRAMPSARKMARNWSSWSRSFKHQDVLPTH